MITGMTILNMTGTIMPTWSITSDRTRTVQHNSARTKKRAVTRDSMTRFHAIDSEGSGKGDSHRLVLVRCGNAYIANPEGISWDEVFSFLYSRFEPGPRNAYVGFYLGYDFTQWLKSLPRERAWRLLSVEGKSSRLRKFRKGPTGRQFYWPVECGDWEFDILGTKRLKIRPRGSKKPWMHVCDTGGFFQSSFLTAINPEKWPEPILTDAEFTAIKRGKERRSDAFLDDDMIYYNELECDVLERLMSSLETGLAGMGIRLNPAQWFGSGQIAQAWLASQNALSTADLSHLIRESASDDMAMFVQAAKESYFGGWFEIMAHGIIPGRTYSYDINSAYPNVIAKLPCLQHGRYHGGSGKPGVNPDSLCLVYARAFTKSQTGQDDSDNLGTFPIGAMLHRDRTGRIARPFATEGWYWKDELDAAIQAKVVNRVEYIRWQAYDPCECPPPLREISDLYIQRFKVGKNTPTGKAYKIGYNSVYGKFAQSVGDPKYGNPVYASRITSGCRTQILNAIATHPGGAQNVLMVATDGVYFLDPHPGLRISGDLGDWERESHDNLCLYKPGVYWNDSDRAVIIAGKAPQFKARGIRARDFAEHIGDIDQHFQEWPTGSRDMTRRPQWMKNGSGWPHIKVTSSFSMTSMTQAIQPGWDWDNAGRVREDIVIEQSAWHGSKRDGLWYDPERGIYRSKPLGDNWDVWPAVNTPYQKKFGMEDPWSTESEESFGITPDGPVSANFARMFHDD
jgi:hypothetical protein